MTEKREAILPAMSDEKKAEFARMQARLRAIDKAAREYLATKSEDSPFLHDYLVERGFTNDEIWIYSPHIGGEVGVDEPDWV